MRTIIKRLQFADIRSSLPRIVSMLIIFLFLLWAASGISSLFDNKDDTIAVENNISQQATNTQSDSALNQLNLFGTSKEETAEIETAPAKITKLRLTLKGIFATGDPKQGAVQIQNDRQQESNFTVGQSIFGKATLDEIYPDRVILHRNGEYETLMLPGKHLNEKGFAVTKRSDKRSNRQYVSKPLSIAAVNAISTNKPTTIEKKINPQVVETSPSAKSLPANKTKTKEPANTSDFRSISISGSGEILRDLFTFDTAWRSGNFVGFIISARNEKGLKMMDVLGIVNNDLITVVNGLRFSEKLESPEQLEKLKTATSIDAIFERDGKEIPFHFNFDTPISNLGS